MGDLLMIFHQITNRKEARKAIQPVVYMTAGSLPSKKAGITVAQMPYEIMTLDFCLVSGDNPIRRVCG